jgi:hypothetical protein
MSGKNTGGNGNGRKPKRRLQEARRLQRSGLACRVQDEAE